MLDSGDTKVIGVWDDHDYGSNNADHRLKVKHRQREIYLDFIGEPQDTERRLNKERGLYQDYVMKTEDGIKVHIVLLDVRFHHNEDFHGDRLGHEQYEWLDRIFTEHKDADVTLIGSGVHVLPERYLSYVEDIGHPAK